MSDKLSRIISILRCPRTGTELTIDGRQLRSSAGEVYPIIEGKPILVRQIEDMHTTPPAANITSQNIAEYIPARRPGWTVHLGSGNVPCTDPMVVSLDILPLPNVDVVAEAEALPFATSAISHIDSGAVFEHLYDPLGAIREVRRVLSDGGSFRIDTAFMQRYHGYPSHYFNMTPQACETFLIDDFILDHSEIPPSGSPIYQIEACFRDLLDALPRKEAQRLFSLSVRDFLAEAERLRSSEWFSKIPEHIKRSLAASVVVCGSKPPDYERRRKALVTEIGEERFARAKRAYYAARVGIIKMHFDVMIFRDIALARGAACQNYPLPASLHSYLQTAHISDPLTLESWDQATFFLCQTERELSSLRERYMRARSNSAITFRRRIAFSMEHPVQAALLLARKLLPTSKN